MCGTTANPANQRCNRVTTADLDGLGSDLDLNQIK